MRLVLVTWYDSHADSGWDGLEEHRRLAAHNTKITCSTAGFLLADEEDHIAVALSVVEDRKPEPLVGDVITIPRRAIESIRTLKVNGHLRP